jgi:DNA-binding transcriptional MerR regulator
MDALIAVGETSRLLAVSAETVRRYADSGVLSVRRDDCGRRWFSRRDVEQLAERRRPKPVAARRERLGETMAPTKETTG